MDGAGKEAGVHPRAHLMLLALLLQHLGWDLRQGLALQGRQLGRLRLRLYRWRLGRGLRKGEASPCCARAMLVLCETHSAQCLPA